MATENLTGAASALARVSQWEASAAQKYEAAERALALALTNQRDRPPETDGDDYEKSVRLAQAQRDDAFNAWKGIADTLHKFDKSVPLEKRDTTERISRDEGEQLLRKLAVYLRTGNEGLITGLCGDVLACRKPEEVHILLASKMRENLVGAVDSALRESHLPAWVKTALADVL